MRVALAVPTTYMNESGAALPGLLRRFGVTDLTKVIIVHDELDLDPGVVRVKEGGGLSGHHGLESIQRVLKSQAFLRVRIGIGRPPGRQSGADHVLRRPHGADLEALHGAFEIGADAVTLIVTAGVSAAMNATNKKG